MLVVRDNPAMSRFEMVSGDALALVEYRRTGGPADRQPDRADPYRGS
jgi:hypothetical protein